MVYVVSPASLISLKLITDLTKIITPDIHISFLQPTAANHTPIHQFNYKLSRYRNIF